MFLTANAVNTSTTVLSGNYASCSINRFAEQQKQVRKMKGLGGSVKRCSERLAEVEAVHFMDDCCNKTTAKPTTYNLNIIS